MNKILTAILAIVVLGIFFAGCGAVLLIGADTHGTALGKEIAGEAGGSTTECINAENCVEEGDQLAFQFNFFAVGNEQEQDRTTEAGVSRDGAPASEYSNSDNEPTFIEMVRNDPIVKTVLLFYAIMIVLAIGFVAVFL